MVTGVVFVDLSAAYDTLNHRCVVLETSVTSPDIMEITKYIRLTEFDESMLEGNRLLFAELRHQRSRWRRLKNGLPWGSLLAPLFVNVCTNDQPRTKEACRLSMQMTWV